MRRAQETSAATAAASNADKDEVCLRGNSTLMGHIPNTRHSTPRCKMSMSSRGERDQSVRGATSRRMQRGRLTPERDLCSPSIHASFAASAAAADTGTREHSSCPVAFACRRCRRRCRRRRFAKLASKTRTAAAEAVSREGYRARTLLPRSGGVGGARRVPPLPPARHLRRAAQRRLAPRPPLATFPPLSGRASLLNE